VLTNVWDAISATTVVEAGGRAIATASAAISAMLGYPDGEAAPWQDMFAAAGRIARAVSVPVTVGAEAGYGLPPRELVDRLLEIGAVGCNLEDTDHRSGGLAEAGAQAQRLAEVRSAAYASGSRWSSTPASTPFWRPAAYPTRIESRRRSGGAALPRRRRRLPLPDRRQPQKRLAALVAELPGPINGNTGAELDLATLRQLGVERVS
jgi:hypothetical protein